MGVSEPLIQTSLLGEAIENGPVVVLVADEHGRYVAVNQAACTFLGYSREELLAMRATDVARAVNAPADWSGLELDDTLTSIATVTRKDGSSVEFAFVGGATVVAGMPVYLSVGTAASRKRSKRRG